MIFYPNRVLIEMAYDQKIRLLLGTVTLCFYQFGCADLLNNFFKSLCPFKILISKLNKVTSQTSWYSKFMNEFYQNQKRSRRILLSFVFLIMQFKIPNFQTRSQSHDCITKGMMRIVLRLKFYDYYIKFWTILKFKIHT